MSAVQALVAACTAKSCAPPPVGTGGSVSRRPPVKSPGMLSGLYTKSQQSLQAGHDHGSDEERAIVSSVSSYFSWDHHQINGLLRGHWVGGHSKETIEATIKNIDTAFEKFGVTLPSKGVVYRGVALNGDMMSMIGKLRPGAVIHDSAFVSTAMSMKPAMSFTGRGRLGVPASQHTVMKITLPKGTRVLAGMLLEEELILRRGSKFKITNVIEANKRSKTPRIIECELMK